MSPIQTLTEALAAYQAANAAETNFLKGLASDKTFLGAFDESVPADKAILDTITANKTAIDTDITAAVANVASALDTAVQAVGANTIFSSGTTLVGANTLAGIVADAKVAATEAIADEQEKLADAQADLTSAEKTALSNLTKRLDAAAAAEKKLDAATTEAVRQKAVVEANLIAEGSSATGAAVIKNTAGNAYIYDTGVTLTADEKALLKPYLDAKNAELKAEVAQTAAITALIDALETVDPSLTSSELTLDDIVSEGAAGIVGDATNGYTLDDTAFTDAEIQAYLVALNDLDLAKVNQEALLKAIASFETVNEISTKYEELAEAADKAEAAIVDSVEDGGLGVAMSEIDGTDTGVFDTLDLFVFAGKDGSLSFLEAGDQLFFGGDYNFVKLSETTDIAEERVGDAAVLEVFYQVQGSDLVLYVEKDVEAGREKSLDNIVTVTLAGVADIAIENGFVTIA